MRHTIQTPRAARPCAGAFLPVSALLAGALALAGCRPPDPTPPETPPAPQADGLRAAVHDPLDKAQAVEQAVEEADARRRETLDDTESGTR